MEAGGAARERESEGVSETRQARGKVTGDGACEEGKKERGCNIPVSANLINVM